MEGEKASRTVRRVEVPVSGVQLYFRVSDRLLVFVGGGEVRGETWVGGRVEVRYRRRGEEEHARYHSRTPETGR